ncbi:lysylphosphatidylglycerol synthase transmembrane domain-containing protein [Haladaptatus salinisoli]|uniref:lysylphosphatidylglycerol synthase transmembrane domain-containing protein n=1 Tax=Haladaptatus salinisoli TaxID=2884876 RepID=UPI001D0B505B|nr:lysylphosphatidylglycerol synthase transmembrane domain-containing protein [Haladaptatus salinisoli]
MTDESASDGGKALSAGLTERFGTGKLLLGFVVAGILIYLLVMVAGWRRVLDALEGADYTWVWVACASTVIGLAAWGKAWQIVLAVLDIEVRFKRLVVTYFAATFANYVTPLGQAGGEPFIAYILSRDTEASYEDSLASVVTADLLNLLPFFNFAALGLSYLLLRASLPDGAKRLAQGLVVLAFGVPAIAYAGWRYRQGVEDIVLTLIGPLANRTSRITLDGVRARIDRFYNSLERIADEPRELLFALVFSYTGWVFFALPLYFAGRSLGLPLELVLVLFIVPASTLAGLTPTPGGLAGVEAALVVLIVALVPTIAPGSAVAAALIYRFASYWFVLGVSGLAALFVIMRS